jgi:hypothetical protein
MQQPSVRDWVHRPAEITLNVVHGEEDRGAAGRLSREKDARLGCSCVHWAAEAGCGWGAAVLRGLLVFAVQSLEHHGCPNALDLSQAVPFLGVGTVLRSGKGLKVRRQRWETKKNWVQFSISLPRAAPENNLFSILFYHLFLYLANRAGPA